jgi:hypothetical protein
MAWIVVTIRVGDANDRPIQRVVGIAHRLDERFAQKQRKTGVAIAGQSLAKSISHLAYLVIPRSVMDRAELLSMSDYRREKIAKSALNRRHY